MEIKIYKRCAPGFCFDCVSGNVCACLCWGVNSRFNFQDFESILVCVDLFCKTNCYFEYWIRIRCIELYMVTWFKDTFSTFFSYGTCGVIFWGFMVP